MRLPLWVEMTGRRVLVVGGGRVGTRRALMFARAGAEVKVAALEFTGELVEAERRGLVQLVKLDALRESGKLRDLVRWADIVVIATDNPQVNSEVWTLAREARKWVNDATDAAKTEIVVPYVGEVFGGRIKLAVTSEGRSGVAARHARDEAVKFLEQQKWLKTMLDVMEALKKALKKLVPEAKRRIPAYFAAEKALLNNLKLLYSGDTSKALELAVKEAAKTVGVDESRLLSAARASLGASTEN